MFVKQIADLFWEIDSNYFEFKLSGEKFSKNG